MVFRDHFGALFVVFFLPRGVENKTSQRLFKFVLFNAGNYATDRLRIFNGSAIARTVGENGNAGRKRIRDLCRKRIPGYINVFFTKAFNNYNDVAFNRFFRNLAIRNGSA